MDPQLQYHAQQQSLSTRNEWMMLIGWIVGEAAPVWAEDVWAEDQGVGG